jgi:GNAT superfamily N-acetyltransferase
MSADTRDAAFELLAQFLRTDAHYLASSAAYGDGGARALARALQLFIDRPDAGFVWIATCDGVAAGACVVCYAISTSRGTLVAKLDDVVVRDGWQRRGVGAAMLESLAAHLRAQGVTRIDSACHRDNAAAWRFYERLGFRPLDEQRIAWLID